MLPVFIDKYRQVYFFDLLRPPAKNSFMWRRIMNNLFDIKIIEKTIGIFVIVTLIVVFWGSLGGIGLWIDKKTDHDEGISVTGISSETEGKSRYITAEASNSGEKVIPYLRVVFGLYDGEGSFVSSVFQEEYDIEPGETRNIRIMFRNENISKYRLVFAEGWENIF